MPMKRPVAIAAVVAPPLVLGAIGLSHPALLSVDNAGWWTLMHELLVPLFPLLGVVVWVLLRRDHTPLAWAGRIAAALFAILYEVLDAMSGIAAGVIVQSAGTTKLEELGELFATGRMFGALGAYALLVGSITALGCAWLAGTRHWTLWVSALALLGSGYMFTMSHIYFPKGTLTMIGLAVGFGLLEYARGRRVASSPRSSTTH